MKRIGMIPWFGWAMLLAVPAAVFAEDVIHRLDGQVVEVDPAKRTLLISYEHPVTDRQTPKEFTVAPNAGLKHVKKLEALKKGDLVSVDYTEHGSQATATYVIYVALKRAFVSRGELAEAMTKIKPAKDK